MYVLAFCLVSRSPLRSVLAWPTCIPEGGPTNATTSDAERHVYELLAHSLDDSYAVIHSTPLLDKQPNGRFLDGEIDFIITHPQLGILLLEVKGGGIAYDGATKQWISTNRQRELQPIKDPFQQAKDGMYRLKRHLTTVAQTKPYAREYWLRYGVWFPDMEWRPGVIPLAHTPDEIALDSLDSLANLAPDATIEHLFRSTQPAHAQPMSPPALAALLDVLAPSNLTPSLSGPPSCRVNTRLSACLTWPNRSASARPTL